MDETLLRANCQNVLRQALDTELGIQVVVRAPGLENPGFRARQTLYRFKNEDRELFGKVVIKQHPDDPGNRIWIVRDDKGIFAEQKRTENQDRFTELDSMEIDL